MTHTLATLGHNFINITAQDALRMGATKFSKQLAALTGSSTKVGPPPGKRVGVKVEVQKDGRWYVQRRRCSLPPLL